MNLKPKYNYLLFFVFIVAANIIVYYPSLNSYFVNDDYNWIKSTSFLEVISSFWGGWGHGALYRPITRLLLYFEFLMFKESPLGYHLISIFIHSSAVYLFIILIRNLFTDKLSIYIVALPLIFFYPFHEVICWISAQTILLCAIFIILSLIYFSRSLIDNNKNQAYYVSLLYFVFALLSYELSLILPLLCILSYYLKETENPKSLKRLIYIIFPFFIVGFIYLIYRKIVLAGLPEANEYTSDLYNWFQNYLKLLNHQYIRNVPLFVLAIISFVYIFYRKKYKYLYFSILWFIIGYLPFLLVNGYTGRFAYFSMYGIVILIGIFTNSIFEKNLKNKIIISVIFISYISFNVVREYQNSVYWHEAGEISRTIPLQLKSLHNGFPDNSILVFYDIPLGYHESGVYLTYFEDSIQRQYEMKLNIIHVSHPLNKDFNYSVYLGKPNVYIFRYDLNKRILLEEK